MSERKLLMYGLRLYQIIGLHPINQNLFDKIKLFIGSTLFIGLVFLFVAELILGTNGSKTLQNMGEFSVSYYQCIFKLSIAIIMRRKMGKTIIPKIFKFMDINQLNVSLQEELNVIYNTMEKIINVYCLNCSVAVVLICLRPIIIRSRIFPIPLYHFIDLTKTPQYELFYFFEVFVLIFLSFLVLGSDVIFFSFIIYIYCELKIIKYKFENLIIIEEDYKNNFKKVSSLVRHHNSILSCTTDLNSLYSVLFLNQCLSSIFGICMSIFVIIANGLPISIPFVLQHILYLFSLFFQLFFYCFAGTQITTQSEDVANSVFHAPFWIDAPNSVKRDVIMVIQRSHKAERISVGGMYRMDLELCASVVKAALSFLNAVLALNVQKE